MKLSTYLLAGMLFFLFNSCEKNKTVIVETEANLKIDIVVTTEFMENAKSENSVSEAEYPFSGENTYSVSKITKTEFGLYDIQKIKPYHEPSLTIHGLADDVAVHSLFLVWGYKSLGDSDFIMQEPIDLLSFENENDNEIYKVKLEEALILLINTIDDNSNTVLKIKISGESDFNIRSDAFLEIPVIVEASTVSPRFELF